MPEKTPRQRLVYRVETPDGDGPYNGGGFCTWFFEVGGVYGRHPVPEDDGLDQPTETERFGFASRRQMRDWFDGAARTLEEAGFRVALYRVPAGQIRDGGRQLVFDAPGLRPVRTMRPTAVLS